MGDAAKTTGTDPFGKGPGAGPGDLPAADVTPIAVTLEAVAEALGLAAGPHETYPDAAELFRALDA